MCRKTAGFVPVFHWSFGCSRLACARILRFFSLSIIAAWHRSVKRFPFLAEAPEDVGNEGLSGGSRRAGRCGRHSRALCGVAAEGGHGTFELAPRPPVTDLFNQHLLKRFEIHRSLEEAV
jgi:hypothetical protein